MKIPNLAHHWREAGELIRTTLKNNYAFSSKDMHIVQHVILNIITYH